MYCLPNNSLWSCNVATRTIAAHKHNKQILQQTHYTLYNSLNSLFLYRTNITTFILGPPSAVGRLQFHQLVKSEARYMVSVRILLQT
ncbi:hypothetical protein HBI24_090690 [Parastagonospora nodorum]|nr:hypothetical protein HBH53_038460 [Parastagonospora nodorum]KAH3976579.1 hypothetical protein HBH52_120180 [Parastagonospora nodorum]KAH4051934.1 hypothetical protein HBH49_109880 [Parastagonospora nodorum]KAH4950044.1 hypothetical protein HBH74_025520 [Parastagonospora nodorum]KAH4960117.1 hypothetical protein HBH73_078200 [Parastagonospora nodorum]